MTAEPNFADRSDRSDLSSAFGRPATSNLRGILPPRPRRSTEHITEVPDEELLEATDVDGAAPDDVAPGDAAPDDALDDAAPDDDAPDEAPAAPPDTVPSPRTRRRGTPASGTAPAAGVANRRWGSVRLSSREHVELLVLVALRRGPAGGRELASRLREDSGGGLVAPPTTVQRTLRHLSRHGLVARDEDNDRRFRLTPLGTRITHARVRAWHAMRRAVDSVVNAADGN